MLPCGGVNIYKIIYLSRFMLLDRRTLTLTGMGVDDDNNEKIENAP